MKGDVRRSGKHRLRWIQALPLILIGCMAAPQGVRPGGSSPSPTPTADPTQAPTPTPTPTAARFSTIQSNILQPKCSGCHSTTTTNKWAYSANQATLWTTMTGTVTYATTPTSPRAYYGQARVVPGDPEKSVLYIKVASSSFSVPDYGNPMPGAALTASEIDLIRNWILAGAPSN